MPDERLREDTTAAIPAAIGRFEVSGVLGKGGMGIVYRALDPSLDRAVAIKVLPEAFVCDPEWIARFRREARLLASLNHPNIEAIWSLEEFAEGRFLLSLELVEGKSLRATLEQGALPVMEAIRINAQVAGAVEAAHSRGIIHRDLKPDNIHVTPEGVVKVLDFGLARHEMPPGGPDDHTAGAPRPGDFDRRAEPAQGDVTIVVSAAGEAGTVLFGSDESVTVVGDRGEITGTPGYMSPEQVQGHFQDRRSDVFSFGCVLYECLCGQAAYGGPTWRDRLTAVLSREPDWSILRDDVPAIITDLVHRCLERDAAARPDSLTTVRRVLEGVLDMRPVPLAAAAAVAGNLPRQISSFVGRQRELAQVRELLTGTSLLTLTGVGGGGKTRLALEVAEREAAAFPGGCWFVELGPVTDPVRVPAAIARSLGVREIPGQPLLDTLLTFLQEKTLLLVLDNCEHLLESSGHLVDALLRDVPGLKVLATSREVLGIAGEATWRIPSLSWQAEAGHRSDAVTLFFERARSVVPAFVLEERAEATVRAICQRLDGIPLAIELAASRVRMLSVDQVLAKLDDRFRLLTGGSRTALERHQTLRAAVDWSFGLLSTTEKSLFRIFSVFPGGWTLEAATAVAAPDTDEFEVLDGLANLVDKSLVVKDEGMGPARYRFLETIRQYAREALDATTGAAAVRDRHAAFYLELAEEAEPKIKGAEQKAWLDRLDLEHGNLRAAIHWSACAPEGAETALRLAGALGGFWIARSHFSAGKAAVEDALGHARSDAYPALRARALATAGSLAGTEGDWTVARERFEASLALFRQANDLPGVARILGNLGTVATRQGETALAEECLEESLRLQRASGDYTGLGNVLNSLGMLALNRGEADRARSRFEEALVLQRELGNRLHVGITMGNLGLAAQQQGDPAAAKRFYEESLAMHRELRNRQGEAQVLGHLGWAARAAGDAAAARDCWLEVLAIYGELANRPGRAEALNNLGVAALADGELGEAASLFTEALALQRALGSPPREARLLANLGLTHHRSGRLAEARACYGESLGIRERTEDFAGAIGVLEGAAAIAAETDAARQAAVLCAAAQRLRTDTGQPLPDDEKPGCERTARMARQALADDELAAARAEGGALDPRSAVRFALAWLAPAESPPPASGSD